MNVKTKRAIALAMVIITILGLLAGISFSAGAATVDYVYVGDYIKNWGTRGTTATFLSPKAEEFYEDNNTSYETLSALSGSSSEKSVPSSALYKTLHNLMESNHDYITSYNATKNLFQYTDCQNSGKTTNDNKISSFYSGTLIGPTWNGGWNREHTWPNSKGDKAGSGENDLMMLRPTSTSENSSRGNKAYGQSSGYYNPNSESNGKYDLRGDVARIILYVYVRWECTNTGSKYNPDGIFGTDGVFESKEVLLDWMEEDPVDTWELGRNDSAESILGTRNVFVDYPELGFALFGASVPEDYETPSGNASASSYTITAVSNNSAWGSVSLSGSTINASAKTGYEVTGYTLLSGSAEISRSGDAFTVIPASDVKVQINFAARSQKTVYFAQSTGIVSSVTAYSDDTIILPAHDGAVQTGHTFMGWVEEAVEETATLPAFYAAGSNYTVTQNLTLYALYARSESGGIGISNAFSLHSGALTEGDYIVVYKDTGKNEDSAMVAALTDKSRLQYAEVTYTGNDIVAPAEDIIWHFAPNGDYWTMYNLSTGKYAGGSGKDNTAALLTSVTEYAKWTAQVKSNDTYEFVNKGNDDKGVNPLLRKNGSVGFACYAKNTTVGGALSLYKRNSGSIVYFTGAAVCAHPDAHQVREQAPSCTVPGYTAGIYCPDCDEYISGHEVQPATNHCDAYQEAAKAPTCTEDGYSTGVYCPDCDQYLSGHEILPAAGHSYADGVCTVCGASEDGSVIIGDLDGDSDVDEDDAIYLLQHVLMPELFPLSQQADFDSNGEVDEDDAIYLLQHVLLPEFFPL